MSNLRPIEKDSTRLSTRQRIEKKERKSDEGRSGGRKQRGSGPDVDESLITNGARPCESAIVMVTGFGRHERYHSVRHAQPAAQQALMLANTTAHDRFQTTRVERKRGERSHHRPLLGFPREPCVLAFPTTVPTSQRIAQGILNCRLA